MHLNTYYLLNSNVDALLQLTIDCDRKPPESFSVRNSHYTDAFEIMRLTPLLKLG